MLGSLSGNSAPIMPSLTLPSGFALPRLITELSPEDTMFNGDDERYLQVGLSALNVIEASLLGAPEPRTILDLPCGSGQVTRMLRERYPAAAITVCDVEPSRVDFTAALFDATGVYSKANFRDLQLGGSFDLIWAGSLLTHLPEHQIRQFLDFAVQHMGQDSRLVATSNGEYVATQMRSRTYGLSEPAARGLIAQYLADGYGYRGHGAASERGISLACRTWYETLLARSGLRLQAYHERGWDRHEDVLVMRRAPAKQLEGKAGLSLDQPDISLLPSPAEQAAQDEVGVPGFDEAWYAETFPDVAAAVKEGIHSSLAAHYLAYGWKEGRPPFDPTRSYARRIRSVPGAWLDGVVGGANRINEAWSVSPEEQATDAGWYWMAHPAVRARSNFLASGDPAQDAYDRLAALLRERGWKLPIPRSISIGCGFGGLERDLSARGMVSKVDAYDIAAGAVVEAERQARQLGLLHVRYHVADLEQIDLAPGSVDAVFAHSSVHHVERLDALYAAARRALRPGGVLHLHEYVGPTRFQWTDAQLRLANEFLDSLPPRLRRLPNGDLKEALRRPTIEEMIAADPSEAIRSEDLIPALAPHFDIIEHCPLGGTLAHIALGGIAQNFDPASPEDAAVLDTLFRMEDAAMAAGTIGSDFATITASPKPFGKRQQGFPMIRSLTARAAALFPPARRLHENVRRLNAAVDTLEAQQARMGDELAALRSGQPAAASPRTAAPVPAPAPATPEVKATPDREMKRETDEAAPREFDEAWYLKTYPDVAAAVQSGALRSGFSHWTESGKAEGRIPPPGYTEGEGFDAEWYATSYHSVVDDIAAGRAQDAAAHYAQIGRFRGYLPNRFAPRPDNPAGIASRFGGTWLDQGNALDLVQGRLDLGEIDEAQAALLRHWVQHGYIILRGAIDEAQVAAAAEDLRRAYEGEMPEALFECPAVGGYRPIPWDPAVQRQPAKALDLHWWSPAIRNLIFAPPVREVLELLFGRRVMASQSLTFLRGSAQGYHQDTLYVPYSLPTQFAASWIALEDVTPGAGELTYLEGSHRLPDFLYGRSYKTLWDAQRMLRKNELRAEMENYSSNLERRGREAGMTPSTFLAKRGDVLIWHADLAHGGLPISLHTTRRSVVTHYCPKEVAPLILERGRTATRVHNDVAWYLTGYYAEG